jgi:L,D-transpeptidase ErfK/SrfK
MGSSGDPAAVEPSGALAAPAAAVTATPSDVPSGQAGKMVAVVSPVPSKPAVDPAWTGVEIYTTRYEDTLLDVAVNRGLGFIELALANPDVDPWLPGAGTQLLLPEQHLQPNAPREGIVLNLPEQRLYYYEKGRLVRSYPVGIGRDGHATPTGTTSVVRKAVDPVWRPTPSARADDPELPAMVPPGPDNPLGSRALYLGWTSYLIHGTNKEYGIGRRASRGCIRMYDDDVRELYQRAAVGTPVTVVDQPVKVGWIGNDLFLEASPTIQQVRQWEEEKQFDPVSAAEARELVSSKAGKAADRIDWAAVDRALAERRGIMTRVTKPEEEAPIATAASDLRWPAPSSDPGASVVAPARRVAPGADGTVPPVVVLGNAGRASGRTGPQTAAAVQDAPPSLPKRKARGPSQSDPSGDELVKWLRSRLSSGSEP